MTEPVRFTYGHMTIEDLIRRQEDGVLNLEPGFQRKSVWSQRDRTKLMESILDGYPVPSIFFYRREDDGYLVYDVLDGKQRLESIFMYAGAAGFGRQAFTVRYRFEDDEVQGDYTWRDLKRYALQSRVLGYQIQTVEVSGDLPDIIDLFVRINSTGKALTGAEKRSAKFYKNPVLQEAQRLAARHGHFLASHGIVTERAKARMKDVELVSELLASILQGGALHKKTAIDRIIGNEAVHAASLRKAKDELNGAFRAIARAFPNLRETRFRNGPEFYSLCLVVWRLQRERKMLNDKKRNRQAQAVLQRLSNGVDTVRERQAKAKGATRHQQLYVDYLMTIQQATDNLQPRKRRAEILEGLLSGLFESKDSQRIFSPAQRRLLWSSEEKRRCSQCNVALDWTNFQVDHIKAHSRGGSTDLENAALICASCNPSKGTDRRARRGRGKRRRGAKR